MNNKARLVQFAKYVVQRKGLGGLLAVIKKNFSLDSLELVIKDNNSLKIWPSNKVLNHLEVLSKDEISIEGTVIKIPFFVTSSETLPVPITLFRRLKENEFKGCFITSLEIEGITVLIGCFKREPLKLTDDQINLLNSLVIESISAKLKNRKPEFNLPLPKLNSFYAVMLNKNLEFTNFSGDFEHLVGVSAKELQEGDIWAEIILPHDRTRLMRAIRRVFSSKNPETLIFKVKNLKTGKFNSVTAILGYLLEEEPKILSIGILNRREKEEEDTQFKVLNLKTVNLIFNFFKVLSESPNDIKLIFQRVTEILLNVLPENTGGLILNKNESWQFIQSHGLNPEEKSLILEFSKIVPINKEIDEVIYENRRILFVNISNSLFSGYFVSIRDISFKFFPYFETFKLIVRLINYALEIVATVESQNKLINIQKNLNKSLSKLWSSRNRFDIGVIALDIFKRVIKAKRGWLGVINSQRTHVEGIAGFGPGIGLTIARSQVELLLRHDYFDEAIKTGDIQIVPPETKLECSGFNEIIERLKPNGLIIIPIKYSKDVIAVAVLEPISLSLKNVKNIMPLIQYISFYLGLVLNALKFEYRVFEADKMKTISIFSAGIAHYLNNIFQSVLGNLSLLEKKASDDLATGIRTAIDSVSKGASLIRKLNDLASPSIKDFELINLNNLIKENEQLIKTILDPQIKLELNLDPKVGNILGNRGSIQQAFLNILINAKEAIGNKPGVVKISTMDVYLKSNEIDPLLPPGKHVCITISDTGRGMSAEELQNCFEPFFSTKSSSDQLWPGLGLSATYSIMRAHGGVATASSTPGVGTTVSLYFPYPLANATNRQSRKSALIISQDQKLVTELRSMLISLGAVMVDDADIADLVFVDLDSKPNSEDILKKVPEKCIGISSNPQNYSTFYSKVLPKPLNIWRIAQTL